MSPALPIDTAKTTEAIAVLLELHQKPMILGQLLKMMYFVDRLFLDRANYSLTRDSYLGKTSGLIPQHIPELIQQLRRDGSIAISGGETGYVTLKRLPQTNALADREVKKIRQVYQQKKDLNPFNLLDWNYDLDFIKNHIGARGTILITPLDIMYGLGKTVADIEIYLDIKPTSLPSKNLSAV